LSRRLVGSLKRQEQQHYGPASASCFRRQGARRRFGLRHRGGLDRRIDRATRWRLCSAGSRGEVDCRARPGVGLKPADRSHLSLKIRLCGAVGLAREPVAPLGSDRGLLGVAASQAFKRLTLGRQIKPRRNDHVHAARRAARSRPKFHVPSRIVKFNSITRWLHGRLFASSPGNYGALFGRATSWASSNNGNSLCGRLRAACVNARRVTNSYAGRGVVRYAR
jgi:hypothetical protein